MRQYAREYRRFRFGEGELPAVLESFERLAEEGGTKRVESCFVLDIVPLNRQNTLVAQCVHRCKAVCDRVKPKQRTIRTRTQ